MVDWAQNTSYLSTLCESSQTGEFASPPGSLLSSLPCPGLQKGNKAQSTGLSVFSSNSRWPYDRTETKMQKVKINRGWTVSPSTKRLQTLWKSIFLVCTPHEVTECSLYSDLVYGYLYGHWLPLAVILWTYSAQGRSSSNLGRLRWIVRAGTEVNKERGHVSPTVDSLSKREWCIIM